MSESLDKVRPCGALALREMRMGGMSYEVRCIFCKSLHRSEWFDESEEAILACRDRAADWQRGLLKDFPNDTAPVKLEASVRAAIEAREAAQMAQGEGAAFVRCSSSGGP